MVCSRWVWTTFHTPSYRFNPFEAWYLWGGLMQGSVKARPAAIFFRAEWPHHAGTVSALPQICLSVWTHRHFLFPILPCELALTASSWPTTHRQLSVIETHITCTSLGNPFPLWNLYHHCYYCINIRLQPLARVYILREKKRKSPKPFRKENHNRLLLFLASVVLIGMKISRLNVSHVPPQQREKLQHLSRSLSSTDKKG